MKSKRTRALSVSCGVGVTALLWLLMLLIPMRASAAGCQFVLGFATLHDAIPNVVGNCIENQANAFDGQQQHTTKGLMVWRKADNFTAFTDGYQSWVNGPQGVQRRLNSQRFSWESGSTAPPLSADSAAALADFDNYVAQLQAADASNATLQQAATDAAAARQAAEQAAADAAATRQALARRPSPIYVPVPAKPTFCQTDRLGQTFCY